MYAREVARTLGLSGFVRNESDGSVCAEAEGEPENLDRFVDWCRRGPSAAAVVGVEVTDIPGAGRSGFGIAP